MTNWQPSASPSSLKTRANLYATLREFFAERQVLEVDTPLLCTHGVTDIHLDNIKADYQGKKRYLQTSPEFAMKRLLAAGSGSIYQICKAFRHEPNGRLHRPEFTMLEWYRVGFNHHQLMDEVDQLLQLTLATKPAERIRYADLLKSTVNIDPETTTLSECLNTLKQHGVFLSDAATDISIDSALDLLISHCIEPQLGLKQPVFIMDYPASQAALARISVDNPNYAERFEVYYQGMELANGFHELTDPKEQQRRFEQDQAERIKHNLPPAEIDPLLMDALAHGLPDCAGIALGLDRLLMLMTKAKHIDEVMSF